MRKTEDSLRRLKKGKKNAFSLFGNTGAGKDEDSKDESRIRAQMILDVEAFGKDAVSLGVVLESSEHFKALKDTIHLVEGMNTTDHPSFFCLTEISPKNLKENRVLNNMKS